MKKINEHKLQAFTIGTMGKRPLSRKEQEELRKKEEEEAAANAFKEFVETFQEAPSNISKVWVKAGTYDAGSRKEDSRDKGKLYKPAAKLEEKSFEKALDYPKLLTTDPKKDCGLKKKSQEKKKSNLELFKEELRQMQEEREERHKYKTQARSMLPTSTPSSASSVEPDTIFKDVEIGSFDNGDPNTTNLFLGNLSPKLSEQELMELFGKYGPLASIKIMWPRSEEEKSRERNCGFVAYMSRKDAERALKALYGKNVMRYEMKLGWGKPVPIMTHPIYIPPSLVEYAKPPPPSGLPFNAQPPTNETDIPKINPSVYMADENVRNAIDKVLYRSIVKVVIPSERTLLALIHRMIEFVIREGPMFEAVIMNREIDNPMFRFLFENDSAAHIYYRWKLFSLLQGDTSAEWRQTEFRMFAGGSIWKPPPVNFYTQGMPEELLQDEDLGELNKGALSNAQRNRLEDLIRHLTPEGPKIGDAMIFCIEHADAADEICECIAESVANPETIVKKKIARLYLVSDILHNCGVKVQNASFFRKSLEKHLVDIFRGLHISFKNIESRLKAEGYKVRVLHVLRAWEEWAVYPREFLNKLKNIFLGLPIIEEIENDIDGAPFSGDEKEDEDLDGVPLDGAALLKGALLRGIPEVKSSTRGTPLRLQDTSQDFTDAEDDIDGIPLDEDIDGIPLEKIADISSKSQSGAFIPSKWEIVDPEQIEAQAITTSKWDTLDPVPPEPPHISRDSFESNDESLESGREFDDDKRSRLREIELKIIQYQDELESGMRTIKSGWNIQHQVQHYRRKLLKKSDKDIRDISPNSKYMGNNSVRKDVKRSESPIEISLKKSKKPRQSPTLQYYKGSPPRSSRTSRKSKSPYSRRVCESVSPIKNSKNYKRCRSRSSEDSNSPKRVTREKSQSPVRTTHYDSSPHKYRSPSPPTKSSLRYIMSPTRTSLAKHSPSTSRSLNRQTRDSSPVRYVKSPQRHRSDKTKYKHKY